MFAAAGISHTQFVKAVEKNFNCYNLFIIIMLENDSHNH